MAPRRALGLLYLSHPTLVARRHVALVPRTAVERRLWRGSKPPRRSASTCLPRLLRARVNRPRCRRAVALPSPGSGTTAFGFQLRPSKQGFFDQRYGAQMVVCAAKIL